MNKRMIFCSIIISGICIQPLSAMLTLTHRTMPRQVFAKTKLTPLKIDKRHQSTNVFANNQKLMLSSDVDIFSEYPYLKHLPQDGLLRKECESLLKKMHLIKEFEKNIVDLTTHYDLQESDNAKINRYALETLDGCLKEADNKGTPVFSSRKELLKHMVTHPSHISLSNCYTHYPFSTTYLTLNTMLLAYAVPLLHQCPERQACALVMFYSFLLLLPTNLITKESISPEKAIYHLLKNEQNAVQQEELKKYQETAKYLQKEWLKRNSTGHIL